MSTTPPIVLVTGANGYIASTLITTLLARGFHVRGTVRSTAAHPWTTSQYKPNYTVVEVIDISADSSALAAAVRGVTYIAHLASSLPSSPDPNAFIPGQVRAALNTLEAAQEENESGGAIKSVVYTSSRTAALHHIPGEPYTQTSSSWNEYALKEAWSQPWSEATMARMMLNYECAKTQSEQEMWAWVKTHNPSFTFNTIVGSVTLGAVPAWRYIGFPSSAALTKMLWEGNVNVPLMVPAEWYIGLEDLALLHVAALTRADVNGERLMAAAEKFSWTEVLGLFRKFAPDRKFLEVIEDAKADEGSVANGRSEELLRKMKDGKGFESLEEVIGQFVRCKIEAEKEGGAVDETSGERLMAAVEGKKE